MPNKIQITTNYQRAVEVSKNVISMLEKKVWPFSQADLFPDAIIPKGISPAHYLFYSVSLDRGRESIDVYRRCRKMVQKLDFSELPNQDPSFIKWFLHENFAKPKEKGEGGTGKVYADPVRIWTENSIRLKEKWNNNPIKLKANTVKQTIKNISTFRGYAKEMSTLLIKNMVRAGIWKFPLNEFNIKIDRHVIRISYGTGVIEIKGQNEIRHDVLVPHLSEVYSRVIKKEGISPIDLDDAFWAIGKYKCGKKNALYCLGNCELGCNTKVYTAKQFTTLKLEQDTRKNTKNLFS